ncbi:MAG: NUDIX domain-containing protein, partial [Alphaproteobacteria bacterium]
GAYTAAAIAAIAFERSATVVDGNVERVMARLFAVETPLPTAKTELKARAADLTPIKRPGDYAQAVMDLGATVCTPRSPDCGRCPWADACVARARGMAAELPRRLPKKARPLRRGMVFWAVRGDGAVLLRRRPEEGLLGGMIEVPSTPWEAVRWTLAKARPHAPLEASWQRLKGVVNHGFTHFELELAVLTTSVGDTAAGGQWRRPEDFAALALPTLTKKVINHVLYN